MIATGDHQLVSNGATTEPASSTTAPPQMHWHEPAGSEESRSGAVG
ncbi:MAG TPA: hypothetical protein VGK58_24870 [Lacipirellulaceae bacterium]